ncbi:SCO2195 family GlnR-regulated protein [Streptomyces sp. H27-D2]|uniref:SCO2195 family GlnR-regulated protein n=1 Tax=Streptomyces sp. H27-D2 TaxID=3046304 RepID=UPI002DB6E79E|nr:hypothetical protein [Streptomyces sp. H27-D2]MEC4017193.1 hypothetical protein [Streptomyces sp. H27-D2]
MQAAPAHQSVRPVRSSRPATPVVRPTVTGTLRALESLLLRGGQRTARRNAWTSVLEDRRRAQDRHEVQDVLEAVATGAPRAT